ncbi:acylglycerol kinase family protein [Altererythrobacter aquiaggeris]|uniref:diacylglycerol/lipid kinase family protein n=1 Tax=Aestuarierythrobacter aquiaggeris TaxID=1898396 RepID=UPI00301817E3
MTKTQKIRLVYNSASGSHDDSQIAELAESLSGYGALERSDCKDDGLPAIRDLDDSDTDLVVIHGGDGTLNGCLTALEGWGGAVLALPGGTSNLLSHTLHGDLGSLDIVALLSRGELTRSRIDCIRWRDGIAVAEILAGPGARWANVREDIRDRDIAGALSHANEVIQRSANGSLARLDKPAAGNPDGYGAIRLYPQSGKIAAAGYSIDGVADFLAQGAAIALRDYRKGPHDDIGQFAEVICRSTGDEPLDLMIDGEIIEGQPSESFSLAPLGLDLLCATHG